MQRSSIEIEMNGNGNGRKCRAKALSCNGRRMMVSRLQVHHHLLPPHNEFNHLIIARCLCVVRRTSIVLTKHPNRQTDATEKRNCVCVCARKSITNADSVLIIFIYLIWMESVYGANGGWRTHWFRFVNDPAAMRCKRTPAFRRLDVVFLYLPSAFIFLRIVESKTWSNICLACV